MFGKELSAALERATRDRGVLRRWVTLDVAIESVRAWADGPVTRRWGVKAATRAYHIFLNHCDVRLTHPFENAPASQRRVELLRAVSGSEGRTVYAASQALAWLARERSD